MNDSMLDKTTRAYHEAGHAVVGCILGHRLEEVNLQKTRDGQGLTMFKPSADFTPRNSAVETFAGPDSEMLFLKRTGKLSFKRRMLMSHYAGADLREVYEFSFQLFGKINDAWLRRCRKKSTRLVERHWPAIRRVAQALIAKDRLTGSEVLKLIAEGKLSRKGP